MVRGAFRRMEHQHYFDKSSDNTIMRDVFSYEAPMGVIGRIVERLLLDRYLRSFLLERNAVIKRAAESDGWREYLSGE